MIRTASTEDMAALESLYRESIYGDLPRLTEWALKKEPERVFIVEEYGKVLTSTYTMMCGYDNLWVSYLVFRDEEAAKRLVDYLLKFRDKKGLRNFYIFLSKGLRER
jgi:hypothetical protein